MIVGIIAALDVELDLLTKALENKEEIFTGAGVYYKGIIGSHNVILTKCGVGKVSAAMSTQELISRFKPDCLINTGCAGGLAEGLKISDVVLASEVVEWDIDTTALGDPRGLISSLNLVEVPASILLSETIRKQIPCDVDVHNGLIASGDQFVCRDDQRSAILSHFPNALCAEMEGAAIGHVAYQNGVPFAVIRSLSDTADSNSEMDYPVFAKMAGTLSAKILINTLKNNLVLL